MTKSKNLEATRPSQITQADEIAPIDRYHANEKRLKQLDEKLTSLVQATQCLNQILDRYNPISAKLEDFDTAAEIYSQAGEFERAATDAMRRATPVQIGPAVGMLIEAFPHAAGKDLAAFAELLCEDIEDKAPTVLALHRAMVKLRQTSEFLPSIGAVLDALELAQNTTQYRGREALRFRATFQRAAVESIGRGLAALGRREEELQAVVQGLAEGKAIGWYTKQKHPDLIAEAQARLAAREGA